MKIIKNLYNTKTVSAIIEQKTVSANSIDIVSYGSYPLRGNEPGVASIDLLMLSLSKSGEVL